MFIVRFRDENGTREKGFKDVVRISKSGGEHKNYIVLFIDGTTELVENKVIWTITGDDF